MIEVKMSKPLMILNIVFVLVFYTTTAVFGGFGVESLKETSGLEAKTTSAVNLRQGAGTKYPVITTIPSDTKILISEGTNGASWKKVLYKGHQGYVSAKYIQVVQSGKTRGSGDKSVKDEKLTAYTDNHYGYSINLPKDWESG